MLFPYTRLARSKGFWYDRQRLDLWLERGKHRCRPRSREIRPQGYRLLQRLVNLGHYFADLRGTVSAPILVDRVGVAIVAATAGPAKRLIVLLLLFLAVYGFALLIKADGAFTRVINDEASELT